MSRAWPTGGGNARGRLRGDDVPAGRQWRPERPESGDGSTSGRALGAYVARDLAAARYEPTGEAGWHYGLKLVHLGPGT